MTKPPAHRLAARLGFVVFSWLCLGACSTSNAVESTSGGEVNEGSDMHVEIGHVETAEELARPAPANLPTEVDEAPPEAPRETHVALADPASSEPTPPPRPTTILAPARSGRLRLGDVHEVIRGQRPDITTCYEEGLSRDSTLSGEAKVRFLIGPQGRIDDAEVYESTLGDANVEACIIGAMRDWRFPRPRPRGSSVLLTYPFLLSTE